jgi:FtsH-binding integral membrane protein
MAMAFAQSARPIQGAVATAGVSDRVAFLRRTYGHLGAALAIWALLTAGIFRYATQFSYKFSEFALRSQFSWLLVLLGFMGIKAVARSLAMSDTSKGAQYAALFLSPLAEAMILQPVLWILFTRYADQNPYGILTEASILTLVIFGGLTLTVFLTKKDFSFLRGILVVGTFASLGIIILAMIFGFNLGIVFCGFMVALLAGYILYETSLVMAHFPPSRHVAAALMLYSSIATLFWYILQILMSRRN